MQEKYEEEGHTPTAEEVHDWYVPLAEKDVGIRDKK